MTSVCTGSFALAAGLLTGRRATSHRPSLDMLAEFGTLPVSERVVVDGPVVVGPGTSSGMDIALHLAALECGEDVARSLQLTLEYDHAPPFDGGSVRTADPEAMRRGRESAQARRRQLAERPARQLT